jgi:hypothetical protein
LAYQPSANSTFLSEQISHQQPASSIFLSEQISTNHQQPGCVMLSINNTSLYYYLNSNQRQETVQVNHHKK